MRNFIWGATLAALTLVVSSQSLLAAPTIGLNGPLTPTQLGCPFGGGWVANTTIDLFFDLNQIAKTSSNASGSWRVCFHVPGNATPEEHSITAVDAFNESATNDLFVSAPWSEYHFGSLKRSASPTENQLKASNVSGLLLDRTVLAPSGLAGSITGITAVEGNLAFTSTDGAGGVDCFRGAEIRQVCQPLVPSGQPQPVAPYVFASDDGSSLRRVMFVGANNGLVSLRNQQDFSCCASFTAVWQQPAGTVTFTGAPSGGQGGDLLCFSNVSSDIGVLFPSADGHLYCIGVSTGAQIWAASLGGHVGSPMILNNQVIFVTNSAGTLFRINRNGSTAYSVAATATMDAPVFTTNLLLITRTDGKVEALNPTNGGVVWTTPAPTSHLVGSVATLGQFAYGITGLGTVYAINLADGTFAWSKALGGSYSRGPAVTPGLVYVAGFRKLSILDAATGALLWSTVSPDTITAGPVVTDGSVYFGTAANTVSQFDLHPSSGGQQQTPVRRSGTSMVFSTRRPTSKSIDLSKLQRDPSMPITPNGGTAPGH